MLYHPEIIIYLWFLPVTIWILIPLALGAVGLSMQLTYRLLFFTQKDTDKRRSTRFDITPVRVKVTDGNHFHAATINNISTLGIGLKNLPKKIFDKADRLTVIINDKKQNHHTLYVQPVWTTRGSSGLKLGARVETASSKWSDFMQHRINKNNTLPGLP